MSTQIGCVIVDDEPLAISILSKYISKHDNLYLIKSFSRSTDALAYLQQHNVELLFLDIHMPKLNGIEFLKKIAEPPLTIFTTAYRDYAVEGFELNATDYLVKPIRFERFSDAIKKIESRIKNKQIGKITYADEVLNIKMNRKNYRIPFKDILYLESNRNNVLIFTVDQEYKCVDTLKNIISKLPANFVRIHRSFLVNKNFVKNYNKQIIRVGLKNLPVGSKYSNTIDCF